MPGDPRYIGGYRLLGRLGEGGMGVVHLGQAPDGRLVAVKVVASRYAQDEEFLLRFRQEGEHARRVPRFCTAEVLDVDVTAQPPYLVTEYIDGPTLTEAVRSGGPLRKAELDQLAVAMATALSAIHGAGLVHRDLKPGNVLLSRMGPRVIDFGIARSLETSAGLTATGVVLGTGSYMPPEQHMGHGVTAASDVFAWGGVMAFAASGRAPFGNGPPHMIAYRVVHGEPDVAPLDPPLREAVSAALRKDPAARPTVGQLLQLLGVPGGGLPVHPRRPAAAPAPPPAAPWPTHPPAPPAHLP
ncbi:serine/threonine-protein kinase, partial [Frankia sp. CiP1_Cm_nod2]|uniref:serine/threonine-protein kinase n=2 Tax=unclassified Frankia TaxID=2632575 RepID=UPI00202482D1